MFTVLHINTVTSVSGSDSSVLLELANIPLLFRSEEERVSVLVFQSSFKPSSSQPCLFCSSSVFQASSCHITHFSLHESVHPQTRSPSLTPTPGKHKTTQSEDKVSVCPCSVSLSPHTPLPSASRSPWRRHKGTAGVYGAQRLSWLAKSHCKPFQLCCHVPVCAETHQHKQQSNSFPSHQAE